MLKKAVSFIVVISLILPVFAVFPHGEKVDISALSAIVMNADTLETVFAKDIHSKQGMASTTKIMTSLLALEQGEPDRVITVDGESVSVEGTSVGLAAGERITLKNLVYAMMLESGNDAANVTAKAVGGSITGFSKMMNERASELGMTETHFANPSGLPDDEHYSTVYDMALLASFAIRVPAFLKICSTLTERIEILSPKRQVTLSNHNRLLREYEGCIGLKTGYTKKSGRCLVSAAERNGVTLVCVTFHAPDDWNDHKKLLDYGFSLCSNDFSLKEKTFSVAVVGGTADSVLACVNHSPLFQSLDPREYSYTVCTEPFLYAPVKAGETVGAVLIYSARGETVASVPLISQTAVAAKETDNSSKPRLFQRFYQFIKGLF